MNQPNHTKFIVGSIALLSAIAMLLGYDLLRRGYQSGELLVTNGGVGGISGLIGFLGGKITSDRGSGQSTIEVSTPPTTTTVTPQNS